MTERPAQTRRPTPTRTPAPSAALPFGDWGDTIDDPEHGANRVATNGQDPPRSSGRAIPDAASVAGDWGGDGF